MSEITHEQGRERKQNIITKQIALSSDIYSVRLIPISANETNIKEIQDFIDKQEMLLELYKGYYKINEYKSMVEFLKRTDEFELIKAKIKELENDK